MINPCNFSYTESESAGEVSDDEYSEYDSSIDSEDAENSEDDENDDYIPFFNYPYKSSPRSNCTVRNDNKPVQISSDMLECLL